MTTSPKVWLARVVFIVCCAALHGCENFVEHVSEGEWHEAGTPGAPPNERGHFVVTPIRPGGGNTVRPGDLVYAHIWTGAISNPYEFNAWLWTGNEPASGRFSGLLEFGPQPLRSVLIGRQVGERFRVTAEDIPCCSRLEIPMFGFEPRNPQHELSLYDNHAWPSGVLSSEQPDAPSAQMEILETCPAHLLERTAQLRQWGYVFNIFDQHYPPSRSGTLTWGALQSECTTAHKALRFEIGPLYDGHGQLVDWDASYARASRLTHTGPLTGLVVFILAFLLGRWLKVRRGRGAEHSVSD